MIQSCIFCLNEVGEDQNYQSRSYSQRELLKTFRKNWSISLCELLDIDKSNEDVFREAEYCSECHRLILNIDSALRSIKVLQEQLRLSKKIIKKYISSNYGPKSNKSFNLSRKLTIKLQRVYRILRNTKPSNGYSVQNIKSHEMTRNKILVTSKKKEKFSRSGRKIKVKQNPDGENCFENPLEGHDETEYLKVEPYIIPAIDDDDNSSHTTNYEENIPISSSIKKEIDSNNDNESESDFIIPKIKSTRDSKKRKREQLLKKSKLKYRCNHPNCINEELKFSNVNAVKRHIIEEHESNCVDTPYHCSECTSQFKSLLLLEKHKNREHSESIFSCISCSKKFGTKLALNRHVKFTHSARSVHLPKCSICFKSFDNAEDIPPHEEAHRQLLDTLCPFSCLFCPVNSFTNNFDLQKHVRQEHEPDLLKCPQCSHVCTSKHNLRAHLTTHNAELLFECNECFKKFRTVAQLKVHILSHSEPKYACDIEGCSKKFHKMFRLNRHKNEVHKLSKKIYKCLLCPKEFPAADLLKNHQVYHSELRPFLCEICSFAVKSKKNLIVHLRTHERNGDAQVKRPNVRKKRRQFLEGGSQVIEELITAEQNELQTTQLPDINVSNLTISESAEIEETFAYPYQIVNEISGDGETIQVEVKISNLETQTHFVNSRNVLQAQFK